MNRLAKQREGIINIFLQDDSGNLFNSITQTSWANPQMLNTNWYNDIIENGSGGSFSKLGVVSTDTLDVYIGAFCKNYNINFHKVTLTVFFRMNTVIDLTQRMLKKNADNYLWLDEKGKPLYNYKDTEWSNMIINRFSGNDEYHSDSFNGYDGYNFVGTCEQSGWMIVSYLSDDNIFAMIKSYFFTILVIFIGFISFVTVFVSVMANKITKPIRNLAEVMKEVSKGNFNVKSDINTNDEIGELSDIFNQMLHDLKKYLDQLIQKEKVEHKMKYSILISQIDPHFIYNTMNTTNFLAQKGQNQDVIKINSALIKILQDRLRINDDDVFDTIEQEMKIVKQYMIIQSYRYGNDVKVNWNIDEKFYNIRVPKDILQPLVENALFHGFTNEDDWNLKSTISIIAEIKNPNYILLKVQDDGRGIEPEKLEKLNMFNENLSETERGKHIGLVNIKKRLDYLYNDNQKHMEIRSELNRGTCVILTLKAERIKEDENLFSW
jgi:sensor histidine kinase YesM